MRTVTIQRPVVDLKSTGAQIKSLRIKSVYTVHDIQAVFGFEYPQAVYAWDRERRLKAGKMLRWSILSESPSSCAAKGGKSIPTIDNLLVLAHLFEKSVEEIVIQRMIEVEVSCVSNKIEKLCNKNCNDCKLRLSA
ncbi:MAG: XRE family transcriptional regulator [Treponema sp.]|nr:XRE family transcriptional regulator [Treponema sp.]